MKSVDKLSVQMGERRVGSLTMAPDGRRCVFEYDKEWIATGFSISPIELPLRTGLFIAQPTPFSGNFGIFEDSLPDGYGRYYSTGNQSSLECGSYYIDFRVSRYKLAHLR